MPDRIRLSRQRGWRKPAGAIVVSRPSRWGNPFTVAHALEADMADSPEAAREVVTETFRNWLAERIPAGPDGTTWSRERRQWMLTHVVDLRSHALACWCPLPEPGQPDWCHAAVLLEIANTEGDDRV